MEQLIKSEFSHILILGVIGRGDPTYYLIHTVNRLAVRV